MRSLILSILLFGCGLANAASVQVDGEHAIGITNLTISGTDYDVVFDDLYDASLSTAAGYDGWIDVFGSGQSELAFDTTYDMAQLFSVAGVVGVKDLNGVDLTGPYNNFGVAIFTDYDDGIPCFEGGSAEAALARTTESTPGSWGPMIDSCVPYDNYLWAGANFKVSAVPVPAAVWLLGSALAGLGWLRRKQSRS
jgi:hypothetical protein